MLTTLARALFSPRPDAAAEPYGPRPDWTAEQAESYRRGYAGVIERDRRDALNDLLKRNWPSTEHDPFGAVGLPRHLWELHGELLDLGYSPEARDVILTEAAREGTLEDVAEVDPEHRERLEATLPLSAAWLGADHDAEGWTTSEPAALQEAC